MNFPTTLFGYDAVFLSFGNGGENGTTKTEFDNAKANKVQNYLEGGGKVYLEGGDALGEDQVNNANLLALFGLAAAEDGAANPVSSLQGQAGAITAGITFSASNQNNTDFIDRYSPGSGQAAFVEDGYGVVAVQHSGVSGLRTFCFSYAIAELADGSAPNTRNNVMAELLDFFALGDAKPNISVQPAAIDIILPSEGNTTTTITISNTGSAPLNWDILGEATKVVLDNNPKSNGFFQSKSDRTRESSSLKRVKAEKPPSLFKRRGVGDEFRFASERPPFIKLPNREVSALPKSGEVNATSGGVSMVLDDGGRENAIGLEAGGQFVWLNRFTPEPNEFPFTLSEIWILFGSGLGVNTGELVDIYIYQDTDGDGDPGTNATFIGSHKNAAVQAADDGVFSVYHIAPLVLSDPGDVIIAVVNRTAGVAADDFPAALDQSSAAGRSWIGSYSNGSPADPPILPATDFWGNVNSFGFAGNWMIRGRGYQNSDCDWLSESPFSGQLLPGESQDVELAIQGAGLPIGTYNCTLAIDSNDPDQPQLSVPVTLEITNIPPEITAIPNQTVNENQVLEVDISATDPDGNTITLSANNLPGFAIFADNGGGNGNITVSPGFEDGGFYPGIEVVATDDGTPPRASSITFDLTVNETNRAPAIDAISDQTIEENATLIIPISASDPDENNISLSAVNLPSFASLVDSGDGSGSITITPGFEDAGDYENIQIIAVDDGVPELSANKSFTLTVLNRNRSPQVTDIADQVMNEGDTLDVAIFASDPDGDEVALSLINLISFASLSDNGDGSGIITFYPGFSDEGIIPVSIAAQDNGTPQLADTVDFLLTINGTNRAPQLTEIADQTVMETEILEVAIAASDLDGDDITLTISNLPDFGSFTDNDNGSGIINFSPGFSDSGTYDSIEVKATDTGTPSLFSLEIFSLEVINLNRAPFAMEDTSEVDEDNELQIRVLENDADPDSDELAIHSVLAENASGSITIDEDETTLFYQPEPDFFGDDEFAYIISDGNNGLDTANVNITVRPVNDAPQFIDLPDSLVFFSGDSGSLDIWQFAHDVETPDAELQYQFVVLPGLFTFDFDLNSGILTLFAKNPTETAVANLAVTIIDPEGKNAVAIISVRAQTTPVGIGQPLPIGIPKTYTVQQNFPNPFNPSTEIRFGLPRAAAVKIDVLNIAGQRVAVLLNERLSAGFHAVQFDAQHLSSGIYFYHIRAIENNSTSRQLFQAVRKMILLK